MRIDVVASEADVISAVSGDDLARTFNNFILDFAPILALFGEQPSKQFMSQSIGWSDSFIFAMAPIGVLIIVASAIRVAGQSGWRSVIGCARESTVAVEMELLSSTSNEVYEVWEGHEDDGIGKIVRKQGKGDIKAFLYDNSRLEVYDLRTARRRKLLELPKELSKEESEELDILPPNLVLNVGGPLVSKLESWILALVAFFLQAGILIIDGVVTYRFDLVTEGSRQVGFPLICSGTVFLCAGIFACSHVIESATKKVKYTPRSDATKYRLIWVQRGLINKSLQDRNGLAIQRRNETKLNPIWVSKKIDQKCDKYWTAKYWTTIGVLLAISGWLMQVEGLRWMHWVAPVLQLGITVLMLWLRSFLRRNLSNPPEITQVHDGHELDWLANKIAGVDAWELRRLDVDLKGPRFKPEDVETTFSLLDIRIKLADLTGWDVAVSDVASNLTSCIQETFNYLININMTDPAPMKFYRDDPVTNFNWVIHAMVNPGGIHPLLKEVDLKVPRAIYYEQIRGKERWGPWRVDPVSITALLSLWTYEFKKGYTENDACLCNDICFVIGPLKEYLPLYTRWISRYSPVNPVYITPNMVKLAGCEEREVHQFQYLGRALPSTDPIVARNDKYEIARWALHRDPAWEYIGYQYKSPDQGYKSKPEVERLNSLIPRIYAQHIYSSFIASISVEAERVEGITKFRRLDKIEEVDYENKPLLNSVFVHMAEIFTKFGLGTEEEAYVCIIPAFKDKIPDVSIKDVGTHLCD